MTFSAPDPLHWALLVAFLAVVGAVVVAVSIPRSPIPMILFCPGCGHQHVDKGEWAWRRHRKHLCEKCGQIWKPAAIPTVGVEELPPEPPPE